MAGLIMAPVSDGQPWLDDAGLITLPCGARLRGRRLGGTVSPADFCLVLGRGPSPAWPYRRIRWPDFGVPVSRGQALVALSEALDRTRGGERVEAACRGGIGRTGTALAALAILDGMAPEQALAMVRAAYHHRAAETIWQRRWLRQVR